jgi:archaeosine-15-forming tRNA-guanine transglycosylase
MDDNGFQDLGHYPRELKELPQNGTAGYGSLVTSSATGIQCLSWRSFDTAVIANLVWASKQWPSKQCIKRLMNLSEANTTCSITLDSKVIELKGLNAVLNQGMRPQIKLMLSDMTIRGFCIVQKKSTFGDMKPPIHYDSIAMAQLTQSSRPDPKLQRVPIPSSGSKPPANSSDRLAQIAYAAGQTPMFKIQRLNPDEVMVKYLYQGPNEPLKFVVYALNNGVPMTDVRVIVANDQLVPDGRGELFIKSYQFHAFPMQRKLCQNRVKLSTSMNDNTPYHAFQHVPGAATTPSNPAVMRAVYNSTPARVKDHVRVTNEMDELLREGAMDAHIQSLRNWKVANAIMKADVRNREYKVTTSNFSNDIPTLPQHMANYSITAPLGQQIVQLTRPPDSPHLTLELNNQRDIVCGHFGVASHLIQAPESLGQSNVQQLIEYGHGVDSDSQSDLTEWARTIISDLVISLFMPHLYMYVTDKANKKAEKARITEEFERERKQDEFLAKIMEQIETEQTKSNEEDGDDNSDKTNLKALPPLVSYKTTSYGTDSVSDARSGSLLIGDQISAISAVNSDLAGGVSSASGSAGGTISPASGPVMKGLRKLKGGQAGSGDELGGGGGDDASGAYTGNYGQPTETDYWLKVLLSSLSISVEITPGLTSSQKEEARVAAESGYIPREEYTRIVASSLGLDPDVVIENLAKQKEEDQAAALETQRLMQEQSVKIASSAPGAGTTAAKPSIPPSADATASAPAGTQKKEEKPISKDSSKNDSGPPAKKKPRTE